MATSYTNSGALWPNDYETTDNHPDIRGSVKVEVGLIEELLDLAVDGQVEIALSGWYKDHNGKEFVSLSAGKPYVKEGSSHRAPTRAAPSRSAPVRQAPRRQEPEDDDQIPF